MTSCQNDGFKILTGNPTEKAPLGKPRLDGRTMLEWKLKK